ncbi:PKD domain-containing protein [Candidatus Pacearchaeota archaeon]|nr:PKD domain-containing protein [Candidatus Pacearchaeota archaeon]
MVNKRIILIFFFAIILIAGIFASYELKDKKYEIQESYSKGENIKGWINISFSNAPAVSVFSDGAGNSVKLIELLKTDSRHKYSCNPANCESSYSAAAPQSSKQISLQAGEEKLIGFVFDQNLDSIEDFNLNIISNAAKSKENQLKIDLFNDGKNDIGNTKAYTQTEEWSAPRDYACFDYTNSLMQEVLIKNGDKYCQRTNLPEAPGYSLGAKLKKASPADSLNIKMSLYDVDLDDSLAGSCDISQTVSIQESSVYCDIDYLVVKQKDYYVCLSAEGSGTYKMKAHTGQCGFYGAPPQDDETAAYNVFSQPRYFDAIETLEISNELPTGEFSSYLSELYIEENYDNLSCKGRQCIVPGFGTTEKNTLHDLSQNSAKITANAQKIYLDKGNFTVPNNLGEYLFKLNIDDSKLFEKQVEVKKGVEILSLNPAKTAAGLPTNFKVRFSAPENTTISEYNWDFYSNGTTRITTANQLSYTYGSIGNYLLTLTLKDSRGGISSKVFNIEVGSAKDILPALIIEKQNDLSNIKGEISTYDLFSSGAIENILNLNNIENNLSALNAEYNLIKDAGTEQQFQQLLSKLLNIELPKSLGKTLDSAPFTFFPKKENIDLSAIETIAGGSYDADLEEEYKDALLTWDLNNVQAKISQKEFSAIYDSGEEPLVNAFKLNIKDLGAQENFFVFVKAMEGIGFKENISYDDSGYYFKEITDGNMEFYTTEDIGFESLPVFISPSLNALNIDSGVGAAPEKAGNKFKWSLFALIVIFVIILGIAVYFILKKWYKNKYENYLFKNKNDLYNMVTFVHSSKQHGKKNDEIAKDLKKSGWSSEQVNYVMKKYSGKNVGMPSFAEKTSVNKNKHQ